MKWTVLDIESKQLVQDWDKPWEAGCSVAGLWISWIGGPWGRVRLFREERLAKMLVWIEQSDLLVTYNGNRYDCPAVSGMAGDFPITPRCDLHELLQESCGHRVKLESVARATLGRGKSGHGDGAPTLWAEGRLDELHSYCQDDVELTRDLFLFAQKHGFLWVPDRNGENRRPVPIDVPGGDAIREVPKEAPYIPATTGQLKYLRDLRPDWNPTPNLTKQGAHQMIEAALNAGRRTV